MREIKFRAWDEEMKTMLDWNTIQSDWESEGYYKSIFEQDHYKCMQYTGLKDKNSKEIYESDIVKFGNFICKVCFYEGTFLMKAINTKCTEYYIHGFVKFKRTEIIGNIHENKELLEQ